MDINKKNIIFNLLALIFLLIFVELTCFTFFTIFKEKYDFFNIQNFKIPDRAIPFLKKMYNAELGWDYQYQTPCGERSRQQKFDIPFISCFGDSFTHCDLVRNNETYEEYLADMLKKDVYNFGVGAYGTDQALMKFRRTFTNVIKTDIVILGLITENINRVVNVYRKYYSKGTGIPLTKPRFVLNNGELNYLPNPIQKIEDITKLQDENFLYKIGKNDWWFNRDNYPVLNFPYTRILFNKRMWMEKIYSTSHKGKKVFSPRPWANLWLDTEASAYMAAIIKSFAEDVRKHNSIPIIALSPLSPEVRKIQARKQTPENIKILRDICNTNKILFCDSTQYFADYISGKDNNEYAKIFNSHLTSYGNQIMAKCIYDFLKANNLLD